MAQVVKNPPAMQETRVRSLGGDNSLEGTATHCSILACRTPMDRGVWRAAVRGVAKGWTHSDFQPLHLTTGGASVLPRHPQPKAALKPRGSSLGFQGVRTSWGTFPNLHEFARAAETKHHRPGSSNRNLLSSNLEAGSLRSRCHGAGFC